MNVCLYCRQSNTEFDTVCKNCGYDLAPKANQHYQCVKLIDTLKKEIEQLKKKTYYAYSNFETISN